MIDLIDRQAAIDAVDGALLDGIAEGIAIEILENLPSVQPVRHGKWTDRNEAMFAPFWERYKCSECGERSENSNYCPNCGADMRGEE